MDKTAIIAALVLAVVLFSGCINIGQSTAPTQQENSTITMSGDAERQVAPDQVQILLGVETNGTLAEDAQRNNSVITNAVVEAFKRAGIASGDVETLDYNLYPNYRYDPETGRQTQEGYTVSQTIKVTTKDLQKAGTLLSVAVEAGANRVQNVQFTLSKTRENQFKKQVLSEAAEAARTKAEAVAQGVGAKLGAIRSVSESNVYLRPYVFAGALEAGAIAKGAPVPPITPSKVTVTASITLTYELSK